MSPDPGAPEEIRLEPVGAGERGLLEPLLKRAHAAAYRDTGDRPARGYPAPYFKRDLLRGPDLFVRASRGPDPVGFVTAGVFGRTGWILDLIVDPDARGEGVGAALLARIAENLRFRGAQAIGIELEEPDPATLGFLIRRDFRLHLPTVLVMRPIDPSASAAASTPSASSAPSSKRAPTPRNVLYSELDAPEQRRLLAAARALSASHQRGLDWTEEIEAATRLKYGDTLFHLEAGGGDALAAFAIFRTRSVTAGAEEALQISNLTLRPGLSVIVFERLLDGLALVARALERDHLALPVPGVATRALRFLVASGFGIRAVALRLFQGSPPIPEVREGLHLERFGW